MADAARALLDELMGRNRNAHPSERKTELNWEDGEFCKYFLVKFCPHDLFTNTRADLGICSKIHDEEAKKLFHEAKASYRKAFYEDEFTRFCHNMISDVDRKIQKGRQRLALMSSNESGQMITPAQSKRNQEQITLLSEKITALVAEAEVAGTRGDVEQAQGLMRLCDQLKEERETLVKQNDNSHWSMTAELAAAQEKQMEVCDICGAFLIVGDAQQRIDDHLMGKQHLGYARLRAAVEEMNKERRKERDADKERDRRHRDDDRDRRQRDRNTRTREDEREYRDHRRRERGDERRRDDRERRDDHRNRRNRDQRERGSSQRDRRRSRSRSRRDGSFQ